MGTHSENHVVPHTTSYEQNLHCYQPPATSSQQMIVQSESNYPGGNYAWKITVSQPGLVPHQHLQFLLPLLQKIYVDSCGAFTT